MKRFISLILATLTLVGSLTVMTSAINFTMPEFRGNSTYVPVTYSGHKTTSTVYLYGKADYLCMRAKCDEEYDGFYVEIYSDSGYKKRLFSDGRNAKTGKTTYNVMLIDLTDLKSGTYYGYSYVVKSKTLDLYGYGKDPDTVKKFKIVVKKGGTTVKNMNTAMYGFKNTANGPRIYWYSVPNSKGYYLYRYDNGKYVKIATVKGGGVNFTSYVDKSMKGKSGSKLYKVAAYDGSGSTKQSYNYCKAYLVITPQVKVRVLSNDKVALSWNSAGKGVEYRVYSSANGSKWRDCGTTSSLKYNLSCSKSGATYSFAVVAEKQITINNQRVNISSGNSPKSVLFIKSPVIGTKTATENSVSIEWNEVGGATHYKVYKKASYNDKWTEICDTTGLSITDNNVKKNESYIYTVRGMNKTVKGSYKESGASVGYIETPVLNDVAKDKNGRPVISWEAIDANLTYDVYLKYGDNAWEYLQSTSASSCAISRTLVSGQECFFTVRAVDKNNIKSSYDKTGKSFVYLPHLYDFKIDVANEGFKLKWSAVDIADQYNIYRKTETSDFELLGKSGIERYVDNTVVSGVKYTYKITYDYKDVEITEAAVEKTASLSDSVVKITDDKIVVTPQSYSVKIDNYNPESTYNLYREIDNEWGFVVSVKPDKNGVVVIDRSRVWGHPTFALSETTKDNTLTKIDNNSFVLDLAEATSINNISINNFTGNVSLSWEPVNGIESYNIYRDGKLIGTSNNCSYIDETTEMDNTYYYSVGFFKDNYSYTSNNRSVTYLLIPTVTATPASYSVKVSWNLPKNPDNYSYYVYRKCPGDTKWKYMASTGAGYYNDSTVINNNEYIYTVKLHKYDQNGGYDRDGTKVYFLQYPRMSLVINSGMVSLSWQKTEGATSYNIYRKTNGSSWEMIKTVSSSVTSYNDKTVKLGTKYQYTVRAVNAKGMSGFNRNYEFTFITAPKISSAKSTKKGITVTWGKVSNADGYYLYRKTANGYKVLANFDSKTTSYTDTTAVKGTKYTYAMKAYSTASSYKTNYSKGVSATR